MIWATLLSCIQYVESRVAYTESAIDDDAIEEDEVLHGLEH